MILLHLHSLTEIISLLHSLTEILPFPSPFAKSLISFISCRIITSCVTPYNFPVHSLLIRGKNSVFSGSFRKCRPDYMLYYGRDCVFLASGLKTKISLINPDVNIKAETMAEKLNFKVMELLDGKQLSISGLSRELKAEGIEEHRLVLTGYLRALRDLELLEETEVPPSKIYSLPEKGRRTQSGRSFQF